MLQYLDANVLLVEYRGFGDSDDAAVNESGLKLDAEAALKFIRTHPRVDPHQIFLFGRSLGGSVAFHLAAHAEQHNIPLAGVMVENTFLSISAMVDTLMPYVAPFKSLILRIGWDSDRIVPHLTVPILYLAGADDQLVPPQHMQKLYKDSKSTRLLHMHIIPGGTHNESWLQGGPEYWQKIKEFMQQAMLAEPVGDAPIAAQTFDATVSSPHTTPGKTPVDIPLMPKNFLMSGFGGNSNKDDPDKTPAKKEN
jgi:pimeloyl-ACP methyl ester carboxylesterase